MLRLLSIKSKFSCDCDIICVNLLYTYDYDSNLVTVKALIHTFYPQCVNVIPATLLQINIFRSPEHFPVSSSALQVTKNTPSNKKSNKLQ